MSKLLHPALALADALNGFRVEIDSAKERADIILDRPPFNLIVMPQRDQLRLVFEALDAGPCVRVIVLRAICKHFSSGGDIKGFLEASPRHAPSSHGRSPRRRDAASRLSPPIAVTASASVLKFPWPAIFVSSRIRLSTCCRNKNSAKSPAPAARLDCRK